MVALTWSCLHDLVLLLVTIDVFEITCKEEYLKRFVCLFVLTKINRKLHLKSCFV